jgi:hypothetical protein
MITVSHARHTASLGTLASLAVLACYTSSGTGSGTDPLTRLNNLPLVEIQPVVWRMSTAADVVRALRPWMLVPREVTAVQSEGPSSLDDARSTHVYVDGILLGGIEVLERIPARSVLNVRRFTSGEAAILYGGRHNGGVLAVTTWANHAAR